MDELLFKINARPADIRPQDRVRFQRTGQEPTEGVALKQGDSGEWISDAGAVLVPGNLTIPTVTQEVLFGRGSTGYTLDIISRPSES